MLWLFSVYWMNEWMNEWICIPTIPVQASVFLWASPWMTGISLWLVPSSGYPFTKCPSSPYPSSPTTGPKEGTQGKEGKQGCSENSSNPAPLEVKAGLGTLFGLDLGQIWDIQTPSPLDPCPSTLLSGSLTLTSVSFIQWLVLPLLFLSLPPGAGAWKDPEPLVGL